MCTATWKHAEKTKWLKHNPHKRKRYQSWAFSAKIPFNKTVTTSNYIIQQNCYDFELYQAIPVNAIVSDIFPISFGASKIVEAIEKWEETSKEKLIQIIEGYRI